MRGMVHLKLRMRSIDGPLDDEDASACVCEKSFPSSSSSCSLKPCFHLLDPEANQLFEPHRIEVGRLGLFLGRPPS